MIHNPMFINSFSLDLPHKTCFKDFSSIINNADHIMIIGRNGSGKSTMLNKIMTDLESKGAITGYVPQIIEGFDNLSGGQCFNQALAAALAKNPDILILDEPTNHLDIKNRKSLMRILKTFRGTLLIASHDIELLKNFSDKIWHIDNDNEKVNVFSGHYNDYINELKSKYYSIKNELKYLHLEKDATHKSLMQEQARAARSKQKGLKNEANKKSGWM